MAVQASVANWSTPQAAAVGIIVTGTFEVFFDTLDTSRKVANLRGNARVAFVIGGLADGEERTVQYEGLVDEPTGPELEQLKQEYFTAFPDGPSRQAWPGLTYVRAKPRWLRFSDFTHTPPEIVELDFGDSLPDTTMTPVGLTSRWIAASRALETESQSPLFHDPFARTLSGDAGFAMLAAMRAAPGITDAKGPEPYLSIRTRFLDDAIVGAAREGAITQAVILAAGMDARAFRLDWPRGLTLFEVDRDDVFDHKEAVLSGLNARPTCDRRIVRADLSQQWTEALIAAGFDPSRPTAILTEGLLMYLDEQVVVDLFASLGALACEGSWIGMDIINTEVLTSPYMAKYLKKLADFGCPWRFGVRDPIEFLAERGWRGVAVVPGEPEANYGRWPFPVMPRNVPGIPRTFLVTARRAGRG
jgi:methyltransferase (TIGR00027 family)